jgi:hypothetical protein
VCQGPEQTESAQNHENVDARRTVFDETKTIQGQSSDRYEQFWAATELPNVVGENPECRQRPDAVEFGESGLGTGVPRFGTHAVGRKAQGLWSVLAVTTWVRVHKGNDMFYLYLIECETKLSMRLVVLPAAHGFSRAEGPPRPNPSRSFFALAASTRFQTFGLPLNNEGSGRFGRKAGHRAALRNAMDRLVAGLAPQ